MQYTIILDVPDEALASEGGSIEELGKCLAARNQVVLAGGDEFEVLQLAVVYDRQCIVTYP